MFRQNSLFGYHYSYMFSPKLKLFTSYPAYLGYFVIVGCVLVYPSLNYPFLWDDLHLIRSYSLKEIHSTWFGAWDTDLVETIGFRPLTTYFNALRYFVFGENVAGHRLLLIVLYAVLLILLLFVAERFTISHLTAFISLLLAFASKYNGFQYVWISDGVHVLQMLFFAISLACLIAGIFDAVRFEEIHYVVKRSFHRLVFGRTILLLCLSVIMACAALLVREDSLNVVLSLPFISIVYWYQNSKTENIQEKRQLKPLPAYLFGYMIALGVMLVGWWNYRATIVTEDTSSQYSLSGLGRHFLLAYLPHGLRTIDAVTMFFVWGWLSFLLLLVVYALIRHRDSIYKALPWVICTFVAASSGGVVTRNNLLIAPTAFAMISLAALVSALPTRPKRIAQWAMIVAVLGAIHISQIASQSFHPFSVESISNNAKTYYGDVASKLTIPAIRRSKLEAQLANLGIHSAQDLDRLAAIEREAAEQKRDRPSSDNEPFISRLPSLYVP